MLRSDLCDYSNTYIVVKGRIIFEGNNANNREDKKLTLKNNAPFRSCISKINNTFLAWKVSKYRVFSGPYFPVFELNTEIYRVNLRIQDKYKEIQTRKSSAVGHFSRSDL